MAANDTQVGGNHYKQFKGMEPWDVITFWGLGYLDGTAVKYLARWRHKNGLEDLKKAAHYIQKQIEVEEAARKPPAPNELKFAHCKECTSLSACSHRGSCAKA